MGERKEEQGGREGGRKEGSRATKEKVTFVFTELFFQLPATTRPVSAGFKKSHQNDAQN